MTLQRNTAYRVKSQGDCSFSIKVRADDRELIDLIRQAFGFAGNDHEISAERYQAE